MSSQGSEQGGVMRVMQRVAIFERRTSQAELLIAAVVFGIAQEPITNLLEARARKVQDEATDTDKPE